MDFHLLGRAKPFVATHLKKDFAAFCRAAWPTLHPGTKLSWTMGHDLICEYLMEVREGRIKRLVINCPPRYSKSTIVNVCWPVWIWLQDASRSFLCCSYEIDLALNMNLDRRRLMDSKWFRDLFADAFTLSTDRSQAGDFSNTSGGAMQAASVNSKAQGRGGDYIVVDDPLSADFAYSESFRNETNLWFTNQLPQRLNNPSESAIVMVAQRLHQADPCGFVLDQEDSEWQLLKLPLVAEEDTTIIFPRSGRVWRRKAGDCLDPKRWSPRTVRERQRNRLVWAGQFQQEPMAAEGNVIRTADLVFFGGRDPQTGVMDPELPENFERKIISVDAAFKDLRTSDYVCVVVVGIVGSRRYLLHVTNSHLDLAGTENEIRNARAAFGPISGVLVEDAANGPSVIAHLKDEIPGLVAVTPQGGKMARLVAASPEFQSGNWIIERNGPWTHKVVEQLTMFPNCKHDDICDAISQASIWLQSHSYELGLVDYFKRVASGAYDKARMLRRMGQTKGSVNQPPATAQARVEGWQRWIAEGRAPVCPHKECKNSCTSYMPSSDGKLRIFCRQCGRYDGQDLPAAMGTCCADFLPQVIGNMVRCGSCGWQANRTPIIAGVSRKDYETGVGKRGIYGRFG